MCIRDRPVDGKANKVHYDLGTEFLTLTGNAELKQLDSKINGERITYDVKKQQLKANGCLLYTSPSKKCAAF